MNAEPRQITPLSPFAGAMVETFFFGFCMAFAMMILFSTRKYVIRVLFVYFVCVLGLQLGLDMYSAWKIEHRDQADVVAGFGEIATIEEPIGIRTLCALTASVIVPVHAFYLVLMMRFNVPMILFIATALFGFIGFLTGIASSVSRTSQNDPGWATDDDGNAFALQCAFYATIFLTDFLTTIALLRVWIKDSKVKGVQIFHHLATLPLVPCIMTAALVCVTGLCKDRSIQLAILMPLGSVHVSTLALYLVKKGSEDHSIEQRNPTNPEKEAMKPAIRILAKPKPALNRAYSQKGVVNITRETRIDNRQIKETVDHQKKTKERVLLESSTPNFLRTDPYTLGKRSMSMASLSRPVTREETLYEQSNSSKYSVTQYKENRVSSSRPASVHSKNIRKRQETEEKERFVKVDFSQSSSPSSRGSSSHGHKKRHQNSPEEENQILETHILCELLTTSPAHSSTSSSSKTSMHLDGTAY